MFFNFPGVLEYSLDLVYTQSLDNFHTRNESMFIVGPVVVALYPTEVRTTRAVDGFVSNPVVRSAPRPIWLGLEIEAQTVPTFVPPSTVVSCESLV